MSEDRTEKKQIGVFGESRCGKTTLVKALSFEFWRLRRTPTLALDPRRSKWGTHAWTTANEEDFKNAVWKKTHCLVIVEDASETIQRDREFSPFFTCITHNMHDLIVIGHDGTDLLPPMRRNLDELFLFNQTEESIVHWQRAQPSMKGLALSVGLDRHEFVHCVKFAKSEPVKQKLRL